MIFSSKMLTTLVVDKLLVEKGITDRKHPSRKNQELAAGGIANAGVAFFGGIPGAMTTSISILIVNEGGNNRSAAVLAAGCPLCWLVPTRKCLAGHY